jgi:antitoxin ParD1/3/4
MSTLHITLPDSMQLFIDEKVAQGGYGTVSDYIQQLISEDQKRAAKKRLEGLVTEALNSGEPREMTAEDWEELKRRVWERHAQGNSV